MKLWVNMLAQQLRASFHPRTDWDKNRKVQEQTSEIVGESDIFMVSEFRGVQAAEGINDMKSK